MAPTLMLFLSILFLSALPDADGVSTVSKVAVQSGRSVTIPCLYDRTYENCVKYWCRGSEWSKCITVVRTDSPRVKGKTSITDDPTQNVFTVTMTNLKMEDSGYYWCAVEIKYFGDDGTRLYLSVTPDADGVSTVNQVAVQSGGSVTIPCLYDREYESRLKYWCRGLERLKSITIARTDSPRVKGKTSITDDPTQHVFTVTMTNLETEDSGYYWCAVEIGDPSLHKVALLYLSVTKGLPGLWVAQQKVVGVEGGHVSVRCHYDDSISMKLWCRAEGSCVGGNSGKTEIKDDHSTKDFIVTIRELNREDTGWYWCAAGELQIPVHITVTQKTTTTTVPTSQSSAPTAATPTSTTKLSISKRSTVPTPLTSVTAKTSYNKRSPDLTIALTILGMLLLGVAVATVTWKLCQRNKGLQPHTGAKEDRRNEPTTVGTGDEVTYSTVALPKSQSSSKRTVGSGDEVTYSTVALPKSLSSHQPSKNPVDEIMYRSLILQDLQTTNSSKQSDRAADVIYSSVARQKTQGAAT